MPFFEIRSKMTAPILRCFDLSRSIDLHVRSMKYSYESAIGGVTSGLIGLNEVVTWRAKHFWVWWRMTSRITAMASPSHFRDEMMEGPFREIVHDHYFYEINGSTEMVDRFQFKTGAGPVADNFILKPYMMRLITQRNSIIKDTAESEKWKEFLQ